WLQGGGMTTWRKGMLAVCVDNSDCGGRGPAGSLLLALGQVYRVEKVTPPASWLMSTELVPGLVLEGVREPHNFYGDWHPSRFRPAVQDWQSEKQSHSITISGLIKEGEPA